VADAHRDSADLCDCGDGCRVLVSGESEVVGYVELHDRGDSRLGADGYAAKKGRYDEAVDVLCRVHDLQPTDQYIVEEMEAIRATIEMETSEGNSKFSALFKNDKLQTRRRVILAYFVLFMNQMGGISMPSVPSTSVGIG